MEKLQEINYGTSRKLSASGQGIIAFINLTIKLSAHMYISNLIYYKARMSKCIVSEKPL